MNPEVIYEDKDIIAVNKPAGLLVHKSKVKSRKFKVAEGEGGEKKEPTLVDWLLKKYPEIKNVGDDPATRPGIVHRLDRDTSGVMVVARTQAAFDHLKSLFMEHRVSKTYRAIVVGVPKNAEGVIRKPIGILNGTLKRSVRSTKMQKEAVTAYRVIESWRAPQADGNNPSGSHKNANHLPSERGGNLFSLLEVRPQTGRTHQIRVHLASEGHPIVGDPLYGPKKQPAWADRLMLHALALEFQSPDGTKMRFEAECPFEEVKS